MKKADSITLMLMGIGLLPVAFVIERPFLQSLLLFASIILNVLAVVRSFKEKKENKL